MIICRVKYILADPGIDVGPLLFVCPRGLLHDGFDLRGPDDSFGESSHDVVDLDSNTYNKGIRTYVIVVKIDR